jgi:hypothetical protein
MMKRVSQTALAIGALFAGLAQAQLVIESGQPAPRASAPASVPPPAPPRTSGLVIVDGYDKPSANPVVAQVKPAAVGRLVQVGKAPPTVGKADGWADNVPAQIALRQIVPSAFTLNATGATKTVSWSGGRPWTEVLATVAQRANLCITLNWDTKSVTAVPADQVQVAQVPSVAAKPIATQPIETKQVETTTVQTTTTTVSAAPPAPVVMVTPVPVRAPLAQSWHLDPSRTLRQNVEAWTKQAGWNRVVWEGSDYPIAAPADFSGTFDAQDGPLAQLIAGYDSSDQPLLVKLSRMDRVVHVINRGYTPAQVESTSAAELAPRNLELSDATPGNVKPGASATPIDTSAVEAGSKMAPISIGDPSARHHH